jgi:hypothetical protein
MGEIPDLVHFRDNNDLSSPSGAFEYIKNIALEVEDGNLSFSDEEFLNYISDVEYNFDYEELTDTDELPEFADFPDLDLYKKTINGVKSFKPTLLSTLLLHSAERDDLTTAEDCLEILVEELNSGIGSTDSESESDESQEPQEDNNTSNGADSREKTSFPLLPYFRSRIALANPYNSSHPNLKGILELAREATETCEDHYLIRVNYGKAVARAYEDDLSFTHDIDTLPDGQLDLINNAIEVIDGAIAIKRDYGPAHAVRARLYALRGELQDDIDSNFEDARDSIKTAIQLEGSMAETSAARRREYTRIQREIRLREQTATTSQKVSQAAREVDDLRENLQQTVDRYRRNTLSFIGFFAALITLAVTSIQILSGQGGTLGDKAILIIVQAGALVFAFGAFGLLLPALKGGESESIERFDSPGQRGLILTGLGLLILVIVVWQISGLPG